MPKVPALVGIVAIVALAALEGLAIWKGIDGAYLAAVTALIAGIAGYSVQPKP